MVKSSHLDQELVSHAHVSEMDFQNQSWIYDHNPQCSSPLPTNSLIFQFIFACHLSSILEYQFLTISFQFCNLFLYVFLSPTLKHFSLDRRPLHPLLPKHVLLSDLYQLQLFTSTQKCITQQTIIWDSQALIHK